MSVEASGASKQRARNKASKHIDTALVVAVVPVAAAAIRIWMYSGGDSALFLALLRTINIPAVLVGTAILIVPTLVLLAAVVLTTDGAARGWAKSAFARNRALLSVLLPILFVVLAYTVGWPTLIMIVVVAVAGIAFLLIRSAIQKRRAGNGANAPAKKGYGPDSIAVLLSVVAVFVILPTNMWLPLEKLTIAKAPDEVGYVLEVTGEWTTLLTSDRQLHVISSSSLERRQVCASATAGTLAMLLQGGGLKNAPSCDK